MATVFTKIIQGELPGRFVWKDELSVAFLSINPIRPGHMLVVPRREVDHWLDLEPTLLAHVTAVAQTVGRAVQAAFSPTKVGLMLAGLEVPHVHVHVIPIRELGDLEFANADPSPKPEDLDAAAGALRAELRRAGRDEVSD